MAGRTSAAAIGGGLAGVALDEIFFVGPRVRRAREVGQIEGRQQRELELRPYITFLEAERQRLQTSLQATAAEVANLRGVNENLKKELARRDRS